MRVLVVEDDTETAASHARYVERCDGFSVAGTCHTAAEAQEALNLAWDGDARIDLMLLDLNLPDQHGLELARDLRASGVLVDIMAVTAVRELEIVRGAVSIGVVHYLIKPFPFRIFADRMRQYQQYRSSLSAAEQLTQQEVDRAIHALRLTNDPGLAKGLSSETLDAVAALIREAPRPWSAGEVGIELGLSRVTARRYLEYLTDIDILDRAPRRGARGRPEMEYRLQS